MCHGHGDIQDAVESSQLVGRACRNEFYLMFNPRSGGRSSPLHDHPLEV